MAALSKVKPLAYIETDNFGEEGTQSATVYRDGKCVMKPRTAERGPVSEALRMLGVVVKEGTSDEFETAGLGRHRNNDDWLIADGADLTADGGGGHADRYGTPRTSEGDSHLFLMILGMPLFFIIGGGIYSCAACTLSREKEPWCSLLLTLGVGVTVFAIGLGFGVPLPRLFELWAGCAVGALVIRLAFGG